MRDLQSRWDARPGRCKRPETSQRCGRTRCRGLRCGFGAPGRIRTADASLRTAALYPLSYGGAGHEDRTGTGLSRVISSEYPPPTDEEHHGLRPPPHAPAEPPLLRLVRDVSAPHDGI